MKHQKMNKEDLLNYAKGLQKEPPFLFANFDRNEAGEVVVKTSFPLVRGVKHDIIIHDNQEFWKTYDFKPLVEDTRRRLMSEMKKGL
jgi:hypothetical protein